MSRALGLPIICLITDRRLVAGGRLVDAVAAAVAGGVNMVQLREKDLPTRELLDLAIQIQRVVEPSAGLLINSRADVAFAARADGVHLPADGLPTKGARAALGSESIIGRSVHSVEEACDAMAGLDYLELGSIFPTRSHPEGPILGIDAIEGVAGLGIRVLAVGGITSDNAALVVRAGASGVAVISAILGKSDPRRAAADICAAVRQAWAQRPHQLGAPNAIG